MSQDTKRMILAMVVALGLMFLYYQFINWKWPTQKPPVAAPATQVAPATQSTAPTTGVTTTQQAATTTAPAPATAKWHARSTGAAGKVTLGSANIADATFALALELTSKGASVQSVTLNQFRKTAQDKVTRYVFQQPIEINGVIQEDTRSLQTRWINIDGNVVDLANVEWKIEASTENTAIFSVEVHNSEQAVVRIIKTYKISKRDTPNLGYEIGVSQKYENLVDRPIAIKTQFNGPTPPPKELEGQPDQNIVTGYWNEGAIKVTSTPIEAEFSPDAKYKEFTKNKDGQSAVWAGEQSAYFNAFLRPVPFDAKEPHAGWISKVSGELLNIHEQKSELRRVALRFETSDFTIPAKETRSSDMEVYFGPKGRKVLTESYYKSLPRQYSETLVIKHDSGIAWLCNVCTWQWLINILVTLLTWFHFVAKDWGVAIIVLVVLVRALLHPITKKSQVHMVKMQKMGPELEKLKKKFADNKDELAKAQMAFYKEQGMTPILGCLPMFLQMPIWIALWNSLQSTFELRHSPLFYGFTWIEDLAKPDYLVRFDQPINLIFGLTMRGINILPLLLGVVFYLSAKLQPKPPTLTPEQKQQQKMMEWMSALLFPLMLYSGPSGLNLYILTSTAFGIVESKVIRKHLKEREELEAKMGPTIVDGPVGQKKEPEKKGWLARLADKAEQIKREAEKRQKGR